MTAEERRVVTVNYEGGSITATRGLLSAVFKGELDKLVGDPPDVSVSVASHSRTRVIGGASSNVQSHSRSYKGWPTSQASQSAAGKVVYITWQGETDWWTARVTGAMADFADFMKANTSQAAQFRTSRGTKYGPFNLPTI